MTIWPAVCWSPKEQTFAQSRRGVTPPLNLLAICAIGIWLTFTRLTYGSRGAMTNSDHLTGLLVFTFSIIAFAEVARALRFLNIPVGLWLIAAPWVLDGASTLLAQWGGVPAGVLIVGLAIPRASIQELGQR